MKHAENHIKRHRYSLLDNLHQQVLRISGTQPLYCGKPTNQNRTKQKVGSTLHFRSSAAISSEKTLRCVEDFCWFKLFQPESLCTISTQKNPSTQEEQDSTKSELQSTRVWQTVQQTHAINWRTRFVVPAWWAVPRQNPSRLSISCVFMFYSTFNNVPSVPADAGMFRPTGRRRALLMMEFPGPDFSEGGAELW